mmetsp:Transcript_3240/g.5880  ORF Transcript_3240/g.5880 Transcript_3240/m.5880 type:complete len:809 (+) Transcript_3240:125-2551(+)
MKKSSYNSSVFWKYRLLEPHAAFWMTGLVVKLAFPSVLKWLAYDSVTTTIISVWYPLSATVSLIHYESQPPSSLKDYNAKEATRKRQFWVDYWSIGFSLAQFLTAVAFMTPVVLRWTLQYSNLSLIMAETKFLFFVWLFVMEPLLVEYQRYLGVDKKDGENWKDFVPLTLIKRAIRPRLLEIQTAISEPVSKEIWQRFIHSKAHRVLNLLVALQFLTEDWCDYLLQILEECRSLLLLLPFLVLPSPITRVGILYVQFLLPSARSLHARGRIIEVLYLQYWVLNNILTVAVSLGSWFLWFIPFSTQIIFAMWCYMTFPRTITQYYAIVEMELITFGILSGNAELDVQETLTIQALRAVVKRIPSANDAEGFQWAEADDDKAGDNQSVKSKKKLLPPRSNSAPATLLAKNFVECIKEMEALSPQKEEEEEEEEEQTTERKDDGVGYMAKRSKSLSAKDDFDLKDGGFVQSMSSKDGSDKTLPPSVSMIEESDDSSLVSNAAMVDVDLSADDTKISMEIKDYTDRRAITRKGRTKSESRNDTDNEGKAKVSSFKPYRRPLGSSLTRLSMAEEQKLCLSPLSRLSTPLSDTPMSNSSCGFDLSDVDSRASSMVEGSLSFDSLSVLHDGSKREERKAEARATAVTKEVPSAAPSTSDDDSTKRRAARRSARLKKLAEKREKEKLLNLTDNLLSGSSTSIGGSKFEEKKCSSTDNQAFSASSGKTPTSGKSRLRKQNSGKSNIERLRSSFESHNSSGNDESKNNNHQMQSPFPRYVRVDAAGPSRKYEGRRTRRSNSRPRETVLASTDSDEVAQ